ncbi:MAG: macro domain-containing protein [Actinomycetota bacterium]
MGIEVQAGDITALDVDVVVNAANRALSHGGGVAAAIARAGRPVVDDESEAWIRQHGPLKLGESAYTGAGSMPARWVVHVVGPRYQEGQDNEGLLRQAVTAALDRSSELGARTVAMPAISTGVYGYPRREAVGVIADEVKGWLDAHPDAIDRVILVGFDEDTAAEFREAVDTG